MLTVWLRSSTPSVAVRDTALEVTDSVVRCNYRVRGGRRNLRGSAPGAVTVILAGAIGIGSTPSRPESSRWRSLWSVGCGGVGGIVRAACRKHERHHADRGGRQRQEHRS